MISHKNVHFVLSLMLLFNSFSLRADQVESEPQGEPVVQAVQAEEVVNPVGEMDEKKIVEELSEIINLASDDQNSEQDDNEGLMDFLEQFQKPTKMAQRLPEECRKEVLEASQGFQSLFSSMQHPTMFLSDIIQDLGIKAEELLKNKPEDTQVKRLVEVLRRVNAFLSSQSFQVAIQFGMFNDKLKKELEAISKDLIVVLQNKSFISLQDCPTFEENLEILHQSFVALKDGNLPLLMSYKSKILQDKKTTAFHLVESALVKLDELSKSLNDDQKDLKEAVQFWQESLKEYSALKDDFDVSGSISQNSLVKALKIVGKTAPFIEGGYALYRKGIELYLLNKDEDRRGSFDTWTGLLLDQSFRMLMVPIYLSKMLSRLSGSNINPLTQQIMLQQIFNDAFAIYFDPNFYVKKVSWPLRAFYRLGSAYGYYHLDGHFNGRLNGCFIDEEKYNGDWWNNKNNPLKKALWFSFKDGYRSFASAFNMQIQKRVDSKILKNIEDNTLGIVKPELLRFVLDTAMPVLARHNCPESLGDYSDNEYLFAKEFGLDGLWDWNYVGKKYDVEKEEYIDKKGKPQTRTKKLWAYDDSYFIEGRILGYLALSVGRHLGKKVTRRYKGPIKSKLSKAARKFISKETLVGMQEMKVELVAGLKELFIDMQDPLMEAGRQMIFSTIVNVGFMTQLEVANFEKEITNDPTNQEKIGLFVDRIMTTIVDNILEGIGGFIGSSVAWIAADYAMKNHGPFYPKAKDYVRRFSFS